MKVITMRDFELSAKRTIIDYCKKNFNEEYDLDDISVIYTNNTDSKNKSGVFVDSGNNTRMYDMNYDHDTQCMTTNVYEKTNHHELTIDDFVYFKEMEKVDEKRSML